MRINARYVCTLFILCLLVSSAQTNIAQTAQKQATSKQTPSTQPVSNKQIISNIETYLKAAMQHDQFCGSVLVAKDGVPILNKGYGMANYELNVPNTPKTVFHIASITKQFTAMAIMLLQERGKLSVHDSIGKYLDNCPAVWQPITVHHLLTHTSGIPNMSSLPDWDEKHSFQPYTHREVIDLVRALPLHFSPGEKFKYSNSGYHLLGLIIEKVSGQSYYDFLQANIFTPLGMKHTGAPYPREQFMNRPQLVMNRASGYYWSLNSFVNAHYENPLIPYSAGSLYSTTEDLLLYDKALTTTKLVSQKSLDAMITPFKNAGYGWEHISQKFNRTIIGHAGSGTGFSTYFMRVPSERVTIIILSNSDEASASKVAYDLAAIVFGAEYRLPEAQPREIITEVLLQKGVEAAVQKYHELKRAQPLTSSPQNSNKFRERLLNSMGYDLLRNGRVKDAIAIFALNCEAFPQSSNVFDSLGEAYLLDKNYTKALENYKKSVELDSKNNHGKEEIKKIEELLKKM